MFDAFLEFSSPNEVVAMFRPRNPPDIVLAAKLDPLCRFFVCHTSQPIVIDHDFGNTYWTSQPINLLVRLDEVSLPPRDS